MVQNQTIAEPFAVTLDPASLATGGAKQSEQIDAADHLGLPRFRFNAQIKTGAVAPTANTTIEFYLARTLGDTESGEVSEDNAGADEAAITVSQSKLVGTIVVSADANETYYASFDVGVVPKKFALIIKNNIGQTLSATAADHKIVGEFYGERVY